jgi:hypothetical protein
MIHPFRLWIDRHMKDAEAEYNRIQALEENPYTQEDHELYERVHQMWGYLAALEKCRKEFLALEGGGRRPQAREGRPD